MGRVLANDATLGLAVALALIAALASTGRVKLEQVAATFVAAQGYAEAVSQGVDAVEPGVFIQHGRL
jgi:hypothetical protein